MVAAVCFFAEMGVFKGVGPGGVVVLPTSVKLVELVRSEGSRVEETFEEVLQVFVVGREDRVGWQWSSGDVDDSQVGRWGF